MVVLGRSWLQSQSNAPALLFFYTQFEEEKEKKVHRISYDTQTEAEKKIS